MSKKMIYLSGIPNIRVNEKPAFIKIKPDHLLVRIDLTKKVEIPIKDIVNVLEKTEQQITKDVTLTRLLTLGVFAFGLRKKRRHTDRYLIIEYVYKGQDVTALFLNPPSGLYSRIFEAMINAKNPTIDDNAEQTKTTNQYTDTLKPSSAGNRVLSLVLLIVGVLSLIAGLTAFTQKETADAGVVFLVIALACFYWRYKKK